MPLTTNQMNYERVAREHLQPGEALEATSGSRRAVVALTDKRLLVSDFPWFGPGRLIFEAPLKGLSEIDLRSLGRGCELSATVGALTRAASLPRVYHSALAPLVDQVRERIAQQGGPLRVTSGEGATP